MGIWRMGSVLAKLIAVSAVPTLLHAAPIIDRRGLDEVSWNVYYDQWRRPFVAGDYAQGNECLSKCENDDTCVGVQFKSNLKAQCYKYTSAPSVSGSPTSLDEVTSLEPTWSVFLKTVKP